MKRLLFILFLSIFSTFLYSAQVKFSAIPTDVKQDGSFDVVLNFSIPKNWHIYGQKTEFGSPTKIDFKLPQGFKLEKIDWAKEKKFKQMGIEYGGYDGETQIFATIAPTGKIDSPKTEKFLINASWLACSDTCQPEEATAEFSVKFVPTTPVQSKTLQFFSIIFGAFLGGIILNLMPCVFPVIGIKILSFAKNAGDSKKSIILNALFYTLGIIASFLILAGILLALRATGESLGWGFQLQNPIFSASMALLFFAMAMSFAGVYEIGSSLAGGTFAYTQESISKNKYVQSAMSGVLAVLVASPCTAPFMGSAVGVALSTQISVIESLVIFASLGFGMASPYIILSAIPRLAKLLPRPGKWLDIFKKILSIPLFITAIWLGWLYSKQTGNFYGIGLSLTILAIGLISYGRFALPHRTRKVRNSAIFGLFVAIVLSFIIILQNKENNTSDSMNIENKWSVAKLDELRKNGYNIYVDFTANWCLTCQYNKQILYSEKIKKIFEQNKIKILVGDWTSRNNAITKALEKFGRAGVPLNLLYSTKGEPIILPAILTESALIEAVDKIK